MNTQKVIYEKLAKQNLGAIEDAVNEAKSNLKNLADKMVAVTRQLETGISVASDAMEQITSKLSDVMRESDSEFYDLQQEAFILVSELDNLGISYDQDLDTLVTNFSSKFDQADQMI